MTVAMSDALATAVEDARPNGERGSKSFNPHQVGSLAMRPAGDGPLLVAPISPDHAERRSALASLCERSSVIPNWIKATLFFLQWSLHIAVTILLWVQKITVPIVWATTLTVLLVIRICTFSIERRLGGNRRYIWNRSIDHFLYALPFAQICFYAFFVTHSVESPYHQCKWFILFDNERSELCMKAILLTAAWVAVLTMACGGFELDFNANIGVRTRVGAHWYYGVLHFLLRMSELVYRLTLIIFVCETIRLWKWPIYPHSPIYLVVPFVVLVVLYVTVLNFVNWLLDFPTDRLLSIFAVAAIMLALNPLYFFTPPPQAYSSIINRCFFLIRVAELVFAVSAIAHSWTREIPDEVCPGAAFYPGSWLFEGDRVFSYQLGASIIVHYLIMALTPGIKHATCEGDLVIRAGLTLDRRAYDEAYDNNSLLSNNESQQRSTFSPSSADPRLQATESRMKYGLCQTIVRLGGGLMFAQPAAQESCIDDYRVLEELGRGQYGVVVKMEKNNELYAMKLIHQQGELLPQNVREVVVYSNIWTEEIELDRNFRRYGHPFIIKLRYYIKWGEHGRPFQALDPDGRNTHTVTDICGNFRFNLGLIMEYANRGNLHDYLRNNFGKDQWFDTLQRFLAQISLALEFLHCIKNVVYRDLKTENVLVFFSNFNLNVKLGDFGFAKKLSSTDNPYATSFAGTPYFVAPEMEEAYLKREPFMRANPQMEKKLDVFSYGVLAYALAYGPGYCKEGGKMLDLRTDHPMCKTVKYQDTSVQCPGCIGCALVSKLEDNLRYVNNGRQLVNLIKTCIQYDRERRPDVAVSRRLSFSNEGSAEREHSRQTLKNHPYFGTMVYPFESLLRLDI